MEQFKKKRLPLLIAGAGGKKSSSSSRTPVEADDTVNSRAMASILDLLGEGVIGGLVDGAKSIFIDDLPILNEDGSANYSGITWDFATVRKTRRLWLALILLKRPNPSTFS